LSLFNKIQTIITFEGMNKSAQLKESRQNKFAYAIIILFSVSFVVGTSGAFLADNSLPQIMLWQGAMTCMISACVLMGAYVAEKGWSFASGGFYLLGIACGSFYSSLAVDTFTPNVMARGIIFLIPAFISIGMSNYLPVVLKWLSISICIPFLILYIRILRGTYVLNEFLQMASFSYLQINSLLWGINIWRELKRNSDADPQAP
jgi:hypothetical protein